MKDRERRPATEEHVADRPVRAAPPRVAGSTVGHSGGGSVHSRKFRSAIITLIAVGVVSLVVALTLTASQAHKSSATSNWSTWQPTASGLAGAQQIADFLSPYYRATSADQLAVVTTMNLNDPANPLQVVIPSQGNAGALQVLPPNSTIAFNLCGIGSHDCSIGVGQPSSDRLLLLRREALELALYTFKYLSGVQTVVAILPPGRTVQACTGICPKPHATPSGKPLDIALAFDRKELQPWLDRPLRATLPEQLPPTVQEIKNAPEAELISVITAHGLFSERTEQAQDGSNLIVLNPLPPQ